MKHRFLANQSGRRADKIFLSVGEPRLVCIGVLRTLTMTRTMRTAMKVTTYEVFLMAGIWSTKGKRGLIERPDTRTLGVSEATPAWELT